MEYTKTARTSSAASHPPAATTWLKLAVVYLIAGISLGIAMGATQNFLLRPVHAHLNLLGWATMALAGLVYSVYPSAARSHLATVHFWLHNCALPVMMGSLTMLLLGHTDVVPVLAASEFVAAAGVICFAVNLFMNLRPDARTSPQGLRIEASRSAA